MDSGWLAVWPIGAFILGGVATQWTGWLNHRRLRAEKAADGIAVQQQRREEFELAHLVEVNQLLRRATEAVRQLDTTFSLYGKRKQDETLTSEHQQELADALEGFRGAVDAVDAQLGFVLADEVREAAGAARDALDAAFARIVTDESVSWRPFEVVMANAYERLSARVREIYAGQPSLPTRFGSASRA
ncbi:hypothetical protein [Streptomyces flavidovirens]|uniref:Secreted protein n=1 Tax=Streptomyces flavidovirens TaxID=67298 RepID=A0ABW6RBH1_9ACTN